MGLVWEGVACSNAPGHLLRDHPPEQSAVRVAVGLGTWVPGLALLFFYKIGRSDLVWNSILKVICHLDIWVNLDP